MHCFKIYIDERTIKMKKNISLLLIIIMIFTSFFITTFGEDDVNEVISSEQNVTAENDAFEIEDNDIEEISLMSAGEQDSYDFLIDFEDSDVSGWSIGYDQGTQPMQIVDSDIFGSKALQLTKSSSKYTFNVKANTVYIVSAKLASTIEGGKCLVMWIKTNSSPSKELFKAEISQPGPNKNEINEMSGMFASGENTGMKFESVNYDSSWGHYDSYQIDDFMVEELKLTSQIVCDNTTVVAPQNEGEVSEYDISTSLKNQYNEAVNENDSIISGVVREWSVTGDSTEGISVDTDTNKLVIADTAQKGQFTVKCTTTVNFNNADPIISEAEETFTLREIPEYKEKEIKKLVDYNFEDGKIGEWSQYYVPKDVSVYKKEVIYDETAKSNVIHYYRAEGNISFTPEPNTLYIALAKMGANGDSFQRLESQLMDNTTKDRVAAEFVAKPVGYTPYDLNMVFYSGDRTSLRYSFIGYDGGSWLYGDYWIDDVIIAEHKPIITIKGSDSVIRPRNEGGTYIAQFEADVKDLTGTEKYIIPGSVKVSWVLNNDYPGITVEKETGKLMVTSEAEYGEIELVCNVTAETTAVLSVVDDVEETKNYTIENTVVKKLSVTPILPVVSDVLPKVSFSDTDINLDCDYTYSHYENVKEKNTSFSWQISEKSDEGFSEISSLKKAEIPLAENKEKYIKLVITPKCENEAEVGYPVETTAVKISELLNTVTQLEKAELSLEADSKIQRGAKISIKTTPENIKAEFTWYRNKDGIETLITCTDSEYHLSEADLESTIYGVATPYDNYEEYTVYGNSVLTNAVEGLSKPVVDNVVINGTAAVGNTLTGNYKYSHKNGVGEGESIYSWEIGGISKSSDATYTPELGDAGKTLVFSVTPVSKDGIKGETKTISVNIAVYQISAGGTIGGGGSSFSGGGASSVKPGTSTATENGAVSDNFDGFSDTKDHWANENIIEMYKKGIAKGNGDNFYPDNKITRAETAAFIARALGVDLDEPKENVFSDVKTSDWYYNNIGILNEIGILKGSDGLANPNNNITREELACLIMRALEYKMGDVTVSKGSFFFDSDNISDWAKESVTKASGLKLLEGSNANFLPKNNATRAETVTVLKRMIDYIETNTKTED